MGDLVLAPVFADAVNEKLGTALKMNAVASDYTNMVSDILVYGNEVHFPSFNRISDINLEVTKGKEITPEEISMIDAIAKVKQTAKSVRIYDSEKAQIKGAVLDAMATQISEVLAKKIDSDLVKETIDNSVFKTALDASNALTYIGIEAAFDCFGDQQSASSYAGIVCHGTFRSSLTAMDQFTKMDRSYSVSGNGIVDDTNCIGFWNGTIPVYLSDMMFDEDNKEPVFAIFKKGALGYILQKQTTVEEQREAKLLATDLVASNLYATKLLDPKGVSILKHTIA